MARDGRRGLALVLGMALGVGVGGVSASEAAWEAGYRKAGAEYKAGDDAAARATLTEVWSRLAPAEQAGVPGTKVRKALAKVEARIPAGTPRDGDGKALGGRQGAAAPTAALGSGAGGSPAGRSPLEDLAGAAWAGSAEAQNALGVCFRTGRGMPQDHQEANRWFALAALQESPEAAFNLATSLYQGWGIAADPARAAGYDRKAAEAGFAPARARLELAARR